VTALLECLDLIFAKERGLHFYSFIFDYRYAKIKPVNKVIFHCYSFIIGFAFCTLISGPCICSAMIVMIPTEKWTLQYSQSSIRALDHHLHAYRQFHLWGELYFSHWISIKCSKLQCLRIVQSAIGN